MKREIEIWEMDKAGYTPLVNFEAWRVAVLQFCDDLKPENIHSLQKHSETDEVFVLLQGRCTLYLAGAGETPGEITGYAMQPEKLYNVKRGVWHSHSMTEDGRVLIVENSDTCDDNSPTLPLTEEQRQQLSRLQ